MTLPIPRKVFDQHIAVLGKTRAGKSSTMRLLVEDLLDRKMPVGIVDPKGDWWGLKLSASGKSAGYPIVIFGGEHADVPLSPRAGAQVAELIATGNRPYLIDMKGWMVGDRTRFWIDFSSTLFKLTKGLRWLVVDEVHNFAPKGKIMDPDAGKALHWTNRLASEGLGMGLHMIFASQRPQKVHNDTLTSAETLIAKRVIHPRDRDAVAEWIDGCGDLALGKKVLAGLAGLDRSEGWVWSPEIGFGPELVRFPMFSTYDSFAPQDAKTAAALKGWASVDLEDVRTKLAAVIEEAKANDPKALRAEVARLQSDIKKLSVPTTNQPSTQVIEAKAYGAGVVDGYARAIEGVKSELANTVSAIDAFEPAFKNLRAAAGQVEHWTKNPPKPMVMAPPRTVLAGLLPTSAPAKPPQAAPRAPTQTLNGTLEKPLQTILNAIVWWHVLGVEAPSHAQVAFIAGYSHKSGTWATYLSKLRSTGLIDGRGNLGLTADGRALAQDPDVPPSGEQLRAVVLAKVDGPLKRIIAPILEAYPNGLSHAAAGERAGYSPSSGTWATYLSKLRSLDLIEGRGELKAQGWLFP